MRPTYFSKQVVEFQPASHSKGIADLFWDDAGLIHLLVVFFEDFCLLRSDAFSMAGDEILEVADSVKGDQIFQFAHLYQ